LTTEQRRAKRTPYLPAGGLAPLKKPISGTNASDQRAWCSATLGARPKYNTTKKQKLSDKGRCFNYGETSHMARAYPRPRKETPRATSTREVCFQKKKEDSDKDTVYKSSGKGEP
jgi:hypothetical protein